MRVGVYVCVCVFNMGMYSIRKKRKKTHSIKCDLIGGGVLVSKGLECHLYHHLMFNIFLSR